MISYENFEIHKHEYVQILKCHKNIDTVKFEDFDTIILIVPGNPGLVEFYEHFAPYLHDHTGLPVIGVSHTGHLSHKSKKWKAASYEQQILDKIKFIKKYLLNKRDTTKPLNIFLIGHSIGCDVILKLLPMLEEQQAHLNIDIKKSILLFPTIERMSLTPSGRVLTPLLNWMLWFILALSYMVTLLPDSVRKRIIHIRYRKKQNDIKPNVLDGINIMASSHACVQSSLVMARDEMKTVKELDLKLVEKYLNNLVIYYGTNDHWCPVHYYHNMVKSLNRSDSNFDLEKCLILDNHGIEHAFVLSNKQTEIISRLTSEWINECLENG